MNKLIVKITNVGHTGETEMDSTPAQYGVFASAEAAGEGEMDMIYESRSPLKAVIKATVKTAEGDYTGYVLEVDPAVADLAGREHLAIRVDASRFQEVRGFVTTTFPVDEAIDFIKVTQG